MDNFLSDLRDDLPFAPGAPAAAPELPKAADVAAMFASAIAAPEFKEACPKCSGSGIWRSWSGFRGGQCFACKGKGFRTFRTSSEDRAKARERAADRKVSTAKQWADAHRPEYDWCIAASARGFDFATQMLGAVAQYGRLTDGQLAAVQKCMARDAERAATRAAEQAQREAAAPAADVSKIEHAFEVARAKGLKRIGVKLARFNFKPAPEHGKNPGAVYVTDAGGQYLGKVLNGRLFATRECGDDRAAEIVKAAADPLAAAVAYGKETGQCAICRRELTDPESIERGIGPICAGKYGW